MVLVVEAGLALEAVVFVQALYSVSIIGLLLHGWVWIL